MNRALERDSGGISAAYERRLRVLCDGGYPAALHLRGRLDPNRWVLEWSFARWVGSALGVDDQISERITLSNVLILASVVMRDDLEDGELAVLDPASARDLGEALFDAAMEPYRELLPGNSPFWPAVQRWMGFWQAATIQAANFEPSGLAVRGTPLKIPAYGLCLLADRAEAFPSLEAAIDHAMTGLVLYDHFADWRDDLASARWNAFVASAIGSSSARPGFVTAAHVETVMLTQPVVADYFARIDRELVAGANCAADVEVADLALHLRRLAGELRDEGKTVSTRYESLGEQATQLMFGKQTVRA
jgi:hypothetical protein